MGLVPAGTLKQVRERRSDRSRTQRRRHLDGMPLTAVMCRPVTTTPELSEAGLEAAPLDVVQMERRSTTLYKAQPAGT